MRKEGWYLILIVLLSTSIYAQTSIDKVIIGLYESTIINGKNITLVGILGESANFRVDADVGTVAKGSIQTISGIDIHLTGLSKNPAIAIINVTVPFNCGDGNCDNVAGEGTSICCKDCGCLSPEDVCISNICVQNITLPGATYECQEDFNCYKGPALCTSFLCDKSYIPYRCATNKITICQPNDNCCAKGCTVEMDADCASIDMCNTVADCEDDNPCTQEACIGTPKRCEQEQVIGCIKNGICIAVGEWEEITYCDASGEFKIIKDVNALCTHDYECLTGDCISGECGTSIVKRIFGYIFITSIIVIGIVTAVYLYVTSRQNQEKD